MPAHDCKIKMKVVDRSKRYRACVDLIDRAKTYSLEEAVRNAENASASKIRSNCHSCRSGLGSILVNPTKWFVGPVRCPMGVAI